MISFYSGDNTERLVELDAARLLIVIYYFALPPTEDDRQLRRWPERDVSRVLSREYYLQKLDFLVRNPAYLAYELVELHRLGISEAADKNQVMTDVRAIVNAGDPELRTDPFRRFWRGAYENIDRVKAWWYARGIVYTETEPRGQAGGEARPITVFFLTPIGETVAERLREEVEAAQWYDRRVRLIHSYFKSIPPARLKDLQYSHPSYRDAQLNDTIPDLTIEQITANFVRVFGEELEKAVEQ